MDVLLGGFVSRSDLGRGGEGSERESEENVLLMLWAVFAEVDRQNCGASASGSGSDPAALLPCLITWRAKQSAWECVKILYLSQPPGALTSCKASPVCAPEPVSGLLLPWVPFFLETLCGRGFGQEFEVSASVVLGPLFSSSGLHWQTLLIYIFFNGSKNLASFTLNSGLAIKWYFYQR